MGKDWRYGLGMVTIVGILGVTAYSIYLWKKQQKQEEESIDLDEARKIVDDNKPAEWTPAPEDTNIREDDPRQFVERIAKIRSLTEDDLDEAFDRAEEERVNAKKLIAKTVQEVEEEKRLEDEEQVEEELRAEEAKYEAEPEPILLEDEGDGKLRYDPNSDEALEQYVRMELADWNPNSPNYKILRDMFDIPFDPTVDGDHDLWSTISDYRAEFFGPASRWTQRVSFADLILHYGRRLDYNLGGGIKYCVNYLLDHSNFIDMSFDEMEKVIEDMNRHDYYNSEKDTFNLFGMTSDQMDILDEIASKSIDNAITYDMEYNEFVKTRM